MKCITWPAILITTGILILIDEFGVSIGRTWPVFFLVIGGVKLLQSNASDTGHLGGPGTLPPPPPASATTPQDEQTQPSGEVNHV
jgi:hypothetical protein